MKDNYYLEKEKKTLAVIALCAIGVGILILSALTWVGFFTLIAGHG